MGKLPLQFDISSSALTETVGFVEYNKFLGTIQFSREFGFTKMPPDVRFALEKKMGRIPSPGQIEGSGRCEIDLLDNIQAERCSVVLIFAPEVGCQQNVFNGSSPSQMGYFEGAMATGMSRPAAG
jgi:hypothetical protein